MGLQSIEQRPLTFGRKALFMSVLLQRLKSVRNAVARFVQAGQYDPGSTTFVVSFGPPRTV